MDPGPGQVAVLVARFLPERGVDRVFGLQGGHIQPIWDQLARGGTQIVDVRDEGAAVHMAHAHSELTGQTGVALATAGPGVTNPVTAMANALRLAEVAEQSKIDPREFGREIMFFSGEPGASVPKVRSAIEEAFGARVVDCGTMAEMTPFMSASATAGTPDGMLLWQDIVSRGVRPGYVPPRAVRGGGDAGVYPSGADLAADDPASFRGPDALG